MRFTQENRSKTPTTKGGVYGFVCRPSFDGPPETAYLLYIGKTKRFRTRYSRYLSDQASPLKARPHIYRMLNKWGDDLWYYFAPINDVDLIDEIERSLMNSCLPPFNVDLKGRHNTAVRLWRLLGSFR